MCDLYHSRRPGAVTNSFTHIHCEDMAHDISIQVSCGTLCSLYPRCYVFFHAYSLWGQQQQERGDDGSFEGWGCCTKRKSRHALQLTHTGLAQYSTWQYCAVLSHSCSALNVVTVHCHGYVDNGIGPACMYGQTVKMLGYYLWSFLSTEHLIYMTLSEIWHSMTHTNRLWNDVDISLRK